MSSSSKRRSILGVLNEFTSEDRDDGEDEERIDMVADLCTMLTHTNKLLTDLWMKIGLTEKDKIDRTKNLIQYHKQLQQQMLDEEKALHDRILTIVRELKLEYVSVCQQLKLSQDLDVSALESLGLLQQEFHLKGKVESLLQLKYTRLDKLSALLKDEGELCKELNMPHLDNGTTRTGDEDVDESNVPSEEQLNEIQQHIIMLQDEKERRLSKFNLMKTDITHLVEDLELIPENEFEDLVLSAENNFAKTLTEENLSKTKSWLIKLQQQKNANDKTLKVLHGRLFQLWDGLGIESLEREEFLSKCLHHGQPTIEAVQLAIQKYQDIKKQNIGKFIERLRTELVSLWDKCFVGPEERENFVSFKEEIFTEELLELHEREVSKWNQMFDDNKAIFTKIVRRNELWEQKKIYDKKSNDPTRFQNRGGNLLQEERARKRLEHDIPKLDLEIEFMIADWEKSQDSGESILIYGNTFQEYIAKERENLKLEIENDKKLRALLKTDEGGKKLNTPTKRKATSAKNTPATSAKKPRGLPMTMGTTARSPAVVMNQGANAASPRKVLVKSPRKAIMNSPKLPPGKVLPLGREVEEYPRSVLTEIQEEPLPNIPRSSMTYVQFRDALKNKDDGVFNSTTTTVVLENIEEV